MGLNFSKVPLSEMQTEIVQNLAQTQEEVSHFANNANELNNFLTQSQQQLGQEVGETIEKLNQFQEQILEDQSATIDVEATLQNVIVQAQEAIQEGQEELANSMQDSLGVMQALCDKLADITERMNEEMENFAEQVSENQEDVNQGIQEMAETFVDVSQDFQEVLGSTFDLVSAGFTGLMDKAQTEIQSELQELIQDAVGTVADAIAEMVNKVTDAKEESHGLRDVIQPMIEELGELFGSSCESFSGVKDAADSLEVELEDLNYQIPTLETSTANISQNSLSDRSNSNSKNKQKNPNTINQEVKELFDDLYEQNDLDDDLPLGINIDNDIPLPEISPGVRQTNRDNLRERMKNGFDGFKLPSWANNKTSNWDAHHVIPWEFLNHGVFDVLRGQGFEWDHNSMQNAIALPTKAGVTGAENLPLHQANTFETRGHPVYNQKVQLRLDDMLEEFELDPERLQQEVDKLLAELKGDMEMGRWAGVPQF